jgi:LCP family protein required for cell wall assembly
MQNPPSDEPTTPAEDLPGVRLTEGEPGQAKPRKRGRRLVYVLSILTGVTLLLCGGVIGGVWLYAGSVENKVKRDDSFKGLTEELRPSKAATAAMNILLLGSDSRAQRDEPESGPDARSDTIIVVHIPAGRDSAQLISVPRDTWVPIPGKGNNKINAGTALGGTPLMVQTVEAFTKVRIDHVVMIDFFGFKDVVDALGGIDIQVESDFTSLHQPKRKFTKGLMHMDGEVALDYSRQRKQFKDGDFSRIEHQQQVIKAVLDKAASKGLLTDLPKLNSFMKATASSLTADRDFSLIDLALELRSMRSPNLTFITSPSKGTGMVGDQSVVFTDQVKAPELFAAVNSDQVGAWLSANPAYAR